MTPAYSAKRAYRSIRAARTYERDRFSSLLGRYRYLRERSAVSRIVKMLPWGSVILDCPCGIGRWWPVLSKKASTIIAADISDEMLAVAYDFQRAGATPVSLMRCDAEQIPLADNSVDYVFSHALTKHLPVPVQYAVLAELARVARKGVVSSFGIFTPLTYEIWRRRNLVESYPLQPEELNRMAAAAGLKLVRKIRCTTVVGVEHTVLLEKCAAVKASSVE